MKNKVTHQAERGTVKIISGINTGVFLSDFNVTVSGRNYLKFKDRAKNIDSNGLIRMLMRTPASTKEDICLVLLIAQKTGDLKRGSEIYGKDAWTFRGIHFSRFCLTEKLKRMLLKVFTVEEYRVYVTPDPRISSGG